MAGVLGDPHPYRPGPSSLSAALDPGIELEGVFRLARSSGDVTRTTGLSNRGGSRVKFPERSGYRQLHESGTSTPTPNFASFPELGALILSSFQLYVSGAHPSDYMVSWWRLRQAVCILLHLILYNMDLKRMNRRGISLKIDLVQRGIGVTHRDLFDLHGDQVQPVLIRVLERVNVVAVGTTRW